LRKTKKSETGEQSLRLIEQVVKLNKKITSEIAAEFKQWSDRYPDQQISLTSLCDGGGIFTWNHAISQGREKLGITEEEAKTWLTRWNYKKLATALLKLWTSRSQFLPEGLDFFEDDIIKSLATKGF
jgi:hypothetical protein